MGSRNLASEGYFYGVEKNMTSDKILLMGRGMLGSRDVGSKGMGYCGQLLWGYFGHSFQQRHAEARRFDCGGQTYLCSIYKWHALLNNEKVKLSTKVPPRSSKESSQPWQAAPS